MIRGGEKMVVGGDKLVIGDLVLCKSGERIPADVRILECESMKVDNSSLTGESEQLSRSPEAGNTLPLEANNLAFSSTFCVDGNGIGLVIATGDNTMMGRIACLVTNIQTPPSPIAIEIDRFLVIISVLSFILGGGLFAACMLLGMPIYETLVYVIGVIVGNIPEGKNRTHTLELKL